MAFDFPRCSQRNSPSSKTADPPSHRRLTRSALPSFDQVPVATVVAIEPRCQRYFGISRRGTTTTKRTKTTAAVVSSTKAAASKRHWRRIATHPRWLSSRLDNPQRKFPRPTACIRRWIIIRACSASRWPRPPRRNARTRWRVAFWWTVRASSAPTILTRCRCPIAASPPGPRSLSQGHPADTRRDADSTTVTGERLFRRTSAHRWVKKSNLHLTLGFGGNMVFESQ